MRFTKEEIKRNAITCMENCMGDLTLGKIKLAHIDFGEACVWSGMLEDMGIYLDEIDEHYNNMLEIYYDMTKEV